MSIFSRFALAVFLVAMGCSESHDEYISEYFCERETREFMDAILTDEFAHADELLKQRVNINGMDCGGVTPLQWLILNDNYLTTDRFRYLLERDADPTINSPKLMHSAFHQTAKLQDSYYLERLINNENVDCDLRSNDVNVPTAIYFAVLSRQQRNLDLLLKCGADVNVLTQNGKNALGLTNMNNWEAAFMLLDAGIDPAPSLPSIINALENNNYTPPTDGSADWREKVRSKLGDIDK
ncbi:hypothetical protein KUV46_00580 [Thalassovita mediterranea]|nr:hypothetical protein KUV46_00580 [Thalassovita mediterranea]